MTRRACGALATALLVATVAASCGDDTGGEEGSTPDTSGTTSAPATSGDAPATTGPLDFDAVETVAEDLEVPWGIAFVDDATMLVTERPGRVRVIEDGELRAEPVAELDVRDEDEGGLLGIAVSPTFAADRFVFLYSTTDTGNRISRFTAGDDLSLADEEVILDGIPSAQFHDGGGLAFGPDEMLYVATGDARQPEIAADPASLGGKVLRLAPDGSIPSDNPTPGSPVWSYGHRNPQGLDWDDDGNLYVSEHGPTGELGGLCCNDEVNLVEPGGFYGWPYLAGTTDALPGEPPAQPTPPVATSNDDTWAPAGLAVRGDDQATVVYVANLEGARLLAFTVGSDPARLSEPDVVLDGHGRLRAATTGPDDCLYVSTSTTDGRGDPDDAGDRILRICSSR